MRKVEVINFKGVYVVGKFDVNVDKEKLVIF